MASNSSWKFNAHFGIYLKTHTKILLVRPNWHWLVEQHFQIQCWILSALEVGSNVQFDRTRDFIERTQFDRTANGCGKETKKKPVWKYQKTAEFSQCDALKYPLWLRQDNRAVWPLPKLRNLLSFSSIKVFCISAWFSFNSPASKSVFSLPVPALCDRLKVS